MYWFSYYFIFITKEAKEFFYWIITIYLSQLMLRIPLSLFSRHCLTQRFFCNDWSFLYLWLYSSFKGHKISHLLIMNYFITIRYIITLCELIFYTCTVWNKAYRGAEITRYGPVFFVPCSKTRDVSTECQELYSFWFGLNLWHGKSVVRIRHWNTACGDPEISLYFQICRK